MAKGFKFNRLVDNIFATQGKLAIDANWGFQKLNEYVQEVELSSSNNANSKLVAEQVVKRKKQSRPTVLMQGNWTRVNLHGEAHNIPEGSIVRLMLTGVMRTEDGYSSRGVRSLCRDIERCNSLQTQGKVSGIIIEANTGGGQALAGQMLKNAIKDSKIPVVTYAHFLGSAGVHGTLTSRKIIAAGNASEIGSIGSMASINKKVAKWYKKHRDDIYSSVSPDKNKAWREYLKGNKKPLIENITNDAIEFQNEVRKYRKLNKEKVEETLRGGMFPAKDALERGLIDGIGTLNDAVNILHKEIEQSSNNSNHNFNYSKNHSNMTFLQRVANKFKERFGLKMNTENPTEADIEQAIDKIPQLQALNTTLEQLTEKLNKLEEKQNKTQKELEASQKENAEFKKGQKTASEQDGDMLTKLNEKLDKLTEDLGNEQKARKDVEQKLADLQAGGQGSKGGHQQGAPDFDQTENLFFNKVESLDGEESLEVD